MELVRYLYPCSGGCAGFEQTEGSDLRRRLGAEAAKLLHAGHVPYREYGPACYPQEDRRKAHHKGPLFDFKASQKMCG